MAGRTRRAGRADEDQSRDQRQPTLLPEKAKPVFVDLFDVYPIDLTKPGGKRMVSRLNGIDVIDFTMPLHEGDRVDLYWEK